MKKILIIIALLIPTALFSQTIGISGGAGIATMDLGQLKPYQDQLIESSIVDLMPFSSFPPYLYMHLGVETGLGTLTRGAIAISHASTGAHANYSDDYGGSMNVDQIVTSFNIGATGYYKLLGEGNLGLSAMGNLSLTYTSDNVSRYVITYNSVSDRRVRLYSFSPSLTAGAELLYYFYPVGIGLEAGYQLNVPVEMKARENDYNYSRELLPASTLKANTSGIRVGLKIILRINDDDLISQIE